MEGCIKNCYLRNRHDLFALYNTLEVCGVVERAKVAAFFDNSLNLVSNENGAGELITTVNYSVANCADFGSRLNNTVLLGYESIKNELESYCMVRHIRSCLIIFLAGNLVLKSGLATDFFANTEMVGVTEDVE